MPKQRHVRPVRKHTVVADMQEVEADKLRRKVAHLEAYNKSLGDLCKQLAAMKDNPRYR